MSEYEKKAVEFAVASSEGIFEKGAALYDPPEPVPGWEAPSAALVSEPVTPPANVSSGDS